MPQIYDNIHLHLADGLCQFAGAARSCAFCVGYLNLRGWDQLADLVDRLPRGKRLSLLLDKPPTAIAASDVIWKFFASHPKQ